jgi:hypothetical protein
MEDTHKANKQVTQKPLTINVPNWNKVMSTHICDNNIPGLPTVLTGHIVPSLAIASLMGICPFCKAGCTVAINNDKCDVMFMGMLSYRDTKIPLLIYGCCQSQIRCVPPQDLPFFHDSAHV